MKKIEDNRVEMLRNALKGRENPFQVPVSYFEDLPGKINDQIRSLESITTEAEQTSSVTPFSIPEGYFEKLPLAISDQINTRNSTIPSFLSRLQKPRIAIPIAFATVFFLAGLYFYKLDCYNSNNAPVKEITADELGNSTYMQSIDEDLFVDFLNNQAETPSDNSIEKYLLDNNIEISQIENEL